MRPWTSWSQFLRVFLPTLVLFNYKTCFLFENHTKRSNTVSPWSCHRINTEILLFVICRPSVGIKEKLTTFEQIRKVHNEGNISGKILKDNSAAMIFH